MTAGAETETPTPRPHLVVASYHLVGPGPYDYLGQVHINLWSGAGQEFSASNGQGSQYFHTFHEAEQFLIDNHSAGADA